MSCKNINMPQSMSENNFDQLPMRMQPRLLPSKKDSAAELRKAVMLLINIRLLNVPENLRRAPSRCGVLQFYHMHSLFYNENENY